MTLRVKDTIEGKISNATNADTVPWSGITGKPSTFTPSSHTHDDRYYTESEVDSKLSGKANSSHTHTKAQITDFPSSMKNPNSLTISLNGTSQGAYDGSAAKSINVTPSSIGAAPTSHSHSYLPLAGGTVSGNVHFSSIGDQAKAAGITWDGSTDGASIYYETRGSDSGHLVLNMTDDSSVTVDIAAAGTVKSYFGYDGTFHGNVAGNASSASSVAWTNISGRPTIPSVGNGTITITQNGATKGSFTLNQSGNATIALTDNDTKYSLPTATSSTLGGVKVGSNITNSSGTISLTKANVTAALGYTPPTSDTNTWRPEEVIISSTQPSENTCKLWIKI